MKYQEIIDAFNSMNSIVDKENFLKTHGVKYTYNSFADLIVWADDGCMEFRQKARWKHGNIYIRYKYGFTTKLF